MGVSLLFAGLGEELERKGSEDAKEEVGEGRVGSVLSVETRGASGMLEGGSG